MNRQPSPALLATRSCAHLGRLASERSLCYPVWAMDNRLDLQGNASQASRLLKALSNEFRLRVLCELVGREMSVGELERCVGLSQSALSQHLAKLRQQGIVKTRRQAQTIYYSIATDDVTRIIELLHALYCDRPTPKSTVRNRAERVGRAKLPALPKQRSHSPEAVRAKRRE